MSDLDGFHGGLVGHPERAAYGGPGVACGAGFGDELGATGGHTVHPLLEGGEGFEGVVGHDLTVTGVADGSQVCNHGCMMNQLPSDCLQVGDRVRIGNGKILWRVTQIECPDPEKVVIVRADQATWLTATPNLNRYIERSRLVSA